MKEEKDHGGTSLTEGDGVSVSVPTDAASHADRECENCGCAGPMCFYWKMHGYVACCPECTHGRKSATGNQASTGTSGSLRSAAPDNHSSSDGRRSVTR